jgi:hypothetical protein
MCGFFLVRTFFIKTKQLGLMKTIRLFILVHKINQAAKKSGNIAIGFYSMYDNSTGN